MAFFILAYLTFVLVSTCMRERQAFCLNEICICNCEFNLYIHSWLNNNILIIIYTTEPLVTGKFVIMYTARKYQILNNKLKSHLWAQVKKY